MVTDETLALLLIMLIIAIYPNKKITNKYGAQTVTGGYDKTQYINLKWDAEEFWKALGLNETKWKEAVKKARL